MENQIMVRIKNQLFKRWIMVTPDPSDSLRQQKFQKDVDQLIKDEWALRLLKNLFW